jgi:hypothetical protein
MVSPAGRQAGLMEELLQRTERWGEYEITVAAVQINDPASSAHDQWWVRFSVRNTNASADPYVGRLPTVQFTSSAEALEAALAYARALIDSGQVRV